MFQRTGRNRKIKRLLQTVIMQDAMNQACRETVSCPGPVYNRINFIVAGYVELFSIIKQCLPAIV